jgi:hypothetical protein
MELDFRDENLTMKKVTLTAERNFALFVTKLLTEQKRHI